MPDRRRFAVVVTPLLALLGVAAAILLPSGAAPAAAQSAGSAVVCFEISVGWRICASSPEPPTPCQSIACIEPAPGAFEQRTFAPGARIDWPHGIFVLDPETGETEGYRAPEAEDNVNGWIHYEPLPGGWIRVEFRIDRQPVTLLLHRATGQSWRWPSHQLRLAAGTSSEHLLFLFEERPRSGDRPSSVRFTLVNQAMEEVGHFSIDSFDLRSWWYDGARFSPDGQTVALSVADTVYLVPVTTAQPAVLFKAEATDDQAQVWLDWRYEGPHIRVIAGYETASGDRRRELHDFSWMGAPLPGPACQGQISPDGRYVASLVGGPVGNNHDGVVLREVPWPSVVIADGATCAPLFRVRSAYTYELGWSADWLSSSEGFVVGVRDGGYLIARLHPTPSLVRLPDRGAGPANPAGSGGASHHFFYITAKRAGPEPAPTGDGRYFGYGPSVYDAFEDRWVGPEIGDRDPYWEWGDSHRERWFSAFWEGHGWLRWLLLPHAIEFPPFSDVIAFRVAGTGSCLRLRAAPGLASEIIRCLPDGARLVLTEPTEPPPDRARCFSDPSQPHPAVAWSCPLGGPPMTWVHIRTEQGAEGWVSHDYLEHDIARCQPRAPAGGRTNDAADLALEDCGLPSTTLTYGAPVTTGSVTDDGDYAFLTDPDDLTTLVTTYEGLRDGSTTGLVIHQTDSAGTSQADFYDLVEPGDIVEWRETADCFVRYTITEVKDDPAGDPPRKLLAVAWMTYAFTGCSGAISSTATASLQFGPLPDLGGSSLTAPVVHGMTQIVPEDWAGAIMEPDLRGDPSGPPPYVATTDLTAARTLPYWREPRLPDDWTLEWAEGGYGGETASVFGYFARYRDERGYHGVDIYGFYARDQLVRPVEAVMGPDGIVVAETRVVAGRPVVVVYATDDGPDSPMALLFDPPTNTGYWIQASGGSVEGSVLDAVLAILGSLFEPPNAP